MKKKDTPVKARAKGNPDEDLLLLQRDLSVALLAQENLDGALQTLLEFACRIPGVDCGGVYRVNAQTGQADLLAHRGLRAEFVAAVARVEPEDPRARLLQEGRPIYVSGNALRKLAAGAPRVKEGLRKLAVVPQRFEGRIVASLNLGSHTQDRFSPTVRAAIESVASLTCGIVAGFESRDAARQAQQNLAMIFETMTDLLLIRDESGRVLHSNRAAQQTLGYTAEELTRLTIRDLISRERWGDIGVIAAGLENGHPPPTILLPLVCRNGQVVQVETKLHLGQWDGQKVFFGIARDISARVQAEQELVRTKEQLQGVIQYNPLSIQILDQAGRTLSVNPAHTQLFGGVPPPDFSIFDDLQQRYPEIAKLLARVRDGETVQIPEVHYNAHDIFPAEPDQPVWVRAVMFPLRGPDRKPEQFVLIHEDITSRRQSEQALREKEAALSKAQEIAHIGSWELDDATHALRWSDEIFRMFGYAPRAVELTMELFLRHVHPDDLAHMNQAIVTAWETRTPLSEDHRILRADGVERIVHEQAEIQYDAAGRPEKWMGTVQDVTESRRADMALQESEANFRNLAENAWYGIFIDRADGNHEYTNRRAAEILGYDPEEMKQVAQQAFVLPGDYPRLRQRLLDRIAGQPPTSKSEAIFRRKDGTEFPVEITSTQTTWRGQVCCMVFFHDISERKRMEAEILRISEWEKKRIGQELHDTLGQSLTGVAYLTEALARDWATRPPPETDKAIEQIAAEARRAVDQVRLVARGLLPVSPEPGGLVAALRGVSDRAQQIHGISCVLQGDGEPEVSDLQMASQLFFITQEAVTNAVRHGQARHIVVRLAGNKQQPVLTIQDDGVGLPVDPPISEGLGLRIMQSRAGLIGATLSVERMEGGGTRVTCRLGTCRAERQDSLKSIAWQRVSLN